MDKVKLRHYRPGAPGKKTRREHSLQDRKRRADGHLQYGREGAGSGGQRNEPEVSHEGLHGDHQKRGSQRGRHRLLLSTALPHALRSRGGGQEKSLHREALRDDDRRDWSDQCSRHVPRRRCSRESQRFPASRAPMRRAILSVFPFLVQYRIKDFFFNRAQVDLSSLYLGVLYSTLAWKGSPEGAKAYESAYQRYLSVEKRHLASTS